MRASNRKHVNLSRGGRSIVRAVGVVAIVFLALAASPWPARATDAASGRQLAIDGQCGRCHQVAALGLTQEPRERSCAACHQWIHASVADPAETARARATYPRWDRYTAHVGTFLDVPDLAASAARLRPAFIASYLRAPFKVRPGLAESMFRTAFSIEEADALGAWLTTEARRRMPGSAAARAAAAIAPSSAPADVQQGRALFATLQCGTCHALGGKGGTAAPVRDAPDLGFVNLRMQPEVLAAYIADPAAFGVETKMPRYDLSATQAARLRDYLSAAARSPAPPAPRSADRALTAGRPPEAPPRYAEVRARVLDAVCIHCHMDPTKNKGEGGPGNTGGLGYRAAGLDLETWAGLRRGARDARGRRVSILDAPPDGGEPLLLRRLRLRVAEHHAELAGPEAVAPGGRPGMPLGLPPLADQDLALVEHWLAAGAPGPDGRSAVIHAAHARGLPHAGPSARRRGRLSCR